MLLMDHEVDAFHIAFEKIDHQLAVLLEQSRGGVDPTAGSGYVEFL